MIRLFRTSAPACLNPVAVADLTAKFIATGASVWQIQELKDALSITSHQKCAFCECKLNEESKYLEVEHFKHKDLYKLDVLTWDNLLLACRRCNGKKSTHDVLAKPIVNPYKDFPTRHFYMKDYRLKHETEEGQESLDVLDLNNSTAVVMVRFLIGEKIHEMLLSAERLLNTYENNPITASKNRFLGKFEGILTEAQAEAAYAATSATVVHGDKIYKSLLERMKSLSLWSDDLEQLHSSSLMLSLPFRDQ